ncbi:MAG: PAS domain S-box protein [Leptospirales bacterium]|nr:PAS domain S-box protein [Leptospirales bacterium]
MISVESIIFLVPNLFSIGIAILVFFRVRELSDLDGRHPLLWTLAAELVWMSGNVCKVVSTDISTKIFWDNFEFLGTCAWPMATLAFGLQYCKMRIPALLWFVLWILPGTIMALAVGDYWLGYLHPNAHLVQAAPFDALYYDFHPIVQIAFVQILLQITMSAILIVARVFWLTARLRMQALILSVGLLIPVMGSLLTITGIQITDHRDTSHWSFAIGNIMIFVALSKFDFARETRFSTLFDRASDAIFLMNAARIVDCNIKCQTVFGREKETLLNSSLGALSPEFQPGGTVSSAEMSLRISRALSEPQFFFWSFKRPNGEIFESEVSLTAINVGGDVLLQAFVRDITERERQARQLELFTRLASDYVYTADLTKEVLEPVIVAGSFERVTGYSLDQVKELGGWMQLILENDRAAALSVSEPILRGEKARVEYRIRRPDGELRWLQDEIIPIVDASGKAVSVMGGVRDITDQKNAEARLRESEARFRIVLENAQAIIFVLDSKGTFLLSEGLALKSIGLSPGEVVGLSAWELYKDNRDVQAQLTSALSGKETKGVTCVNGRFFETVYSPYKDAEKGVMGVIGVATDISEKISQQEELLRKNAELERFSYTVSHDLKSPLITIRGFAGNIISDLDEGSTENLKSDLARILVAAEKMRSLLDDLLQLSRVGRKVNPPTVVNLNEAIQEVLDLLAGSISKHSAVIHVQPGMPAVYMDRKRLVEVLQNLLENAIKYRGTMPPEIEIKAETDSAYVTLSVKDNGLGIAKEYRDVIFGLFNKLNLDSEGTGIGLALVRRIVELYGGSIRVESDGMGHGSTFYCTLPRPGR